MDTKWIELVKTPEGYEYTRRKKDQEAVVIAALTEDGQVILISQDRPPVNSRVLEFPAGLVEPNEAPLVGAKRELLEETGYESSDWLFMGNFPTSPGMSAELINFYVALNCKKVSDKIGVDGEQIEVHLFDLDTIGAALNDVRKNVQGMKISLKVFTGVFFLREVLASRVVQV